MNKPIIASPQVTNHILHRFKLRADKKLGQNFLIDENIVRRIVEAAELSPADKVLEVGPGIGTLTQGLAESGADDVAVELDKRLLPVLDVTLEGYDNVRIVNCDILQVNIMETVAAPEFKVCANLPYYITTPIIFALLEKRLPMERLVAMVQKEVAERMAAKPGSRDYGALSVAIQYYTEPEIAFIVPPTSFIPAPAVDSAVIVCKRRSEPPVKVCDEALFFRIFSQTQDAQQFAEEYGHQLRAVCSMAAACRRRRQAQSGNSQPGGFCGFDQYLRCRKIKNAEKKLLYKTAEKM